MTDHLTAPLTNRSLPIALLRAREKVMGPIRAMLSDVGVTEQQWRVLRVLDERGPLDPTEIADRSVLLLPSLTRILQTLVAKGLVSRSPHPTDRRKQVVSITANAGPAARSAQRAGSTGPTQQKHPAKIKNPAASAGFSLCLCSASYAAFAPFFTGAHRRLLVRYSSDVSSTKNSTATKPACLRAIIFGSAAHIKNAATSCDM
jgi:homoprotocatechuate degradation regulator HpaR